MTTSNISTFLLEREFLFLRFNVFFILEIIFFPKLMHGFSIKLNVKKAIQKDHQGRTTTFLLSTLALGILFVILQFVGFGQIVANGYYFTGQASSITTTFLYIVTVVHLLHLAGGLISLLIIIYNHFKQKYNSTQTLGIELGAMYWHFLDLLWVYLFLFLYFFK